MASLLGMNEPLLMLAYIPHPLHVVIDIIAQQLLHMDPDNGTADTLLIHGWAQMCGSWQQMCGAALTVILILYPL